MKSPRLFGGFSPLLSLLAAFIAFSGCGGEKTADKETASPTQTAHPAPDAATTASLKAAAPETPATVPTSAPAPPSPRRAVEDDAPTSVTLHFDELTSASIIANTANGALRLRALVDVLRYSELGPMQPTEFPMQTLRSAGPEKLDEAGLWFAVRRTAYEELPSTDPAVMRDQLGANAPLIQSYVDTRQNAIRDGFVRAEIEDKAEAPSEAKLKETYEKEREQFKREYSFHMRHLILMTYKKHKVAGGETLESIAKSYGLPEDKIGAIRADVPSKPQRREEGKLFKDLEPGESLLIPMNDAEADARKAELIADLEKMKSENLSFEDLCKKYSDSELKGEEIGPLPTGTRPMLDQILEIGKKLKVGEISEPFRTSHGWQVIQKTKEQQAGYSSFEEVRPYMAQQMQNMSKIEAAKAAIDGLYNQPGLVIHYDLIAQGNTLKGDPVVMEFKNHQYKWESDFVNTYWDNSGRPLEKVEIQQMLHRYQALQAELLNDWYAKWSEANPHADVVRQIENLKIAHMGTAALAKKAAEEGVKLYQPADIEAFYKQHIDDIFSEPAQYTLSLYRMRLKESEGSSTVGPTMDPAQTVDSLREQMETSLKEAKTAEDFNNLAAIEQTQSSEKMPEFIGKPVRLEQLPQILREPVAKLEVGKWTPPIVDRDNGVVVSLLLESRKDKVVLPFNEQNKPEILNRMIAARQGELIKIVEKQYLGKTKYASTLVP